MALALGNNGSNGIAFLVAGGIVAEILAFCCSSPQTAELNAEKRAETLMKYVHIGQILSIAFIGVAVIMDKKHAAPILAGGGSMMIIAEGLYLYARNTGLRNPGTPTEDW